jgi:hypothetical protein
MRAKKICKKNHKIIFKFKNNDFTSRGLIKAGARHADEAARPARGRTLPRKGFATASVRPRDPLVSVKEALFISRRLGRIYLVSVGRERAKARREVIYPRRRRRICGAPPLVCLFFQRRADIEQTAP